MRVGCFATSYRWTEKAVFARQNWIWKFESLNNFKFPSNLEVSCIINSHPFSFYCESFTGFPFSLNLLLVPGLNTYNWAEWKNKICNVRNHIWWVHINWETAISVSVFWCMYFFFVYNEKWLLCSKSKAL